MKARRKLVGLLIAGVVALGVAAPAGAFPTESTLLAGQQFESSKGWYFTDLVNCAGTEAAIADQPLQIFASNYLQYPVGGECGGTPVWKNAQVGDFAVKWVLQFASQLGGWSKCKERGWDYNNTATSYMDVTNQWSTLPCGHGLYRAKSVAKYNKNGTWHQGSRTTAAINKS